MDGLSRRARAGILAVGLLVLALAASSVGEAGTFYRGGTTGYDVSFPQCGTRLPRDGAFGIVGVTNGLPWSANPCLKTLYQWAQTKAGAPSLYMNTANPGPVSKYWNRPGPGECVDTTSYSDTGCAYNYGWNAAADAFAVASAATSGASASNFWWLDVETVNSWDGTQRADAAALEGYIDSLRNLGVAGVGIYSTSSQWSAVTGGVSFLDVPNWVAGASSAKTASKLCSRSFSGGEVWLVQHPSKGFDGDYVCR